MNFQINKFYFGIHSIYFIRTGFINFDLEFEKIQEQSKNTDQPQILNYLQIFTKRLLFLWHFAIYEKRLMRSVLCFHVSMRPVF